MTESVTIESLSIDRGFAYNTSIVLVGARGTGKSSLATIAWKALRLHHIEISDVFYKRTGMTRSAFKLAKGSKECRHEEARILKDVLTTNTKGCVIVCPPESIEQTSLSLIAEHALSHPVIHVTRSSNAVQGYLSPWDSVKVKRMLEASNHLYRTCANLEFYNLDEDEFTPPTSFEGVDISSNLQPTPRSLRLKYVEEVFVRFIKKTLDPDSFLSTQPSPLPPLAPPRSSYTYLLPITLSDINSDQFRIEELNCGADVCQLEVDSVFHSTLTARDIIERISRAFAILRRFFRGPIVYQVESTSNLQEDEDLYFNLLHHGLKLGADFVTVDLRCSERKTTKLHDARGFSQIIGHFHDSSPGWDGWFKAERLEIYKKAAAAKLEGVRLTQRAESIHDNFAAISFQVEFGRIYEPKPFLIAYNTGSLGRSSQCCNQIFTPITSSHSRAPNAPTNDLTIRSANHALYSMFYFDVMRYHIVGFDVSYSLSPAVHNATHELFGMPHRMTGCSTSSIEKLKRLIENTHCGGISIAQGYKLTIFPLVSLVSSHAANIGAINTIIPIRTTWEKGKTIPPSFWRNRNRAGPVLGIYGDNTDWICMAHNILRNLSPANGITSKTVALVIGAGGMARAAIYALVALGVQNIMIYNRTPKHAEALANHFTAVDVQDDEITQALRNDSLSQTPSHDTRNIQVLTSLEDEWRSDIAQSTIVICCIPASTVIGKPGANFTLPKQWMKSPTGGVVIDMNYRPFVTPLLRQVWEASERGWVAVDGVENLCAQASVQFELFTGRKISQNYMRVAALKHYEATKDL